MLPPGPIISLLYRVSPERRADLLAFLRDAVPFYERPGGVRVGLYESADDPGLYLELVAYAHEAAYAMDQERVEHDVEMLAVHADGVAELMRMWRSKPDPEPYLVALAQTGLDRSECLVIEDSERGLRAARAAGLACWVIPTALTRGGDFRAADRVLGSVAEVVTELAGEG